MPHENLQPCLHGSPSTLLLAACGGSDPDVPGSGSPSGAPTTAGTFAAVVSFGDSLSDIGSYAPATSLAGNGASPYFGGRFTTNDTTTGAPTATPLGKVWVENLAASLGLVVTPAEVGFAGTSVQCPAAACLHWPAPAPPTVRAARA